MSNNTTESTKYHGTPCIKCGNTLRWRHSGACHFCKCALDKRWRLKNKDRLRPKNREKSKRWKENNPEKVKEIRRKASQAPGYKAKAAKWQREYRRRNRTQNYSGVSGQRITPEPKDQRRARDIIKVAVADGNIPPVHSRSCADCGKQAKYHHHEDYTKPLEVVPLCASCHGYRHSPHPA